jgi:hypothetical protein
MSALGKVLQRNQWKNVTEMDKKKGGKGIDKQIAWVYNTH